MLLLASLPLPASQWFVPQSFPKKHPGGGNQGQSSEPAAGFDPAVGGMFEVRGVQYEHLHRLVEGAEEGGDGIERAMSDGRGMFGDKDRDMIVLPNADCAAKQSEHAPGEDQPPVLA